MPRVCDSAQCQAAGTKGAPAAESAAPASSDVRPTAGMTPRPRILRSCRRSLMRGRAFKARPTSQAARVASVMLSAVKTGDSLSGAPVARFTVKLRAPQAARAIAAQRPGRTSRAAARTPLASHSAATLFSSRVSSTLKSTQAAKARLSRAARLAWRRAPGA